MKQNKRFGLRNLLSTVLVVALTMCVALTVACSGANTSDSSSASSSASNSTSTVARTDYQVITNGDFEYGTDSKEASDYPVSSSVNWTRSNDSLLNSATSSTKLSGIIDTETDAYNTIAKDQSFPVATLSGEGEQIYYNPHTPEYYGLVTDDELYEYDEDVENEDKLPTKGTKVLMIHNVTSEDGRGTAQKFTSTKTFEVDSFAKVSVWVATKNLKTVQDTDAFGAYVMLRTTIDSEVSPLVIKNINTDGEWINVSFYLAAHDFATTQFRLVLGLGFGSKDVRQEYVEGFAYFDNVTYSELSENEYLEATANVDKKFDYYTLNNDHVSEMVEKEALVWSMADAANLKEVKNNADHVYTAYAFDVNCAIETYPYFIDSDAILAKVNDNYAHADAAYGSDVLSGYAPYSEIASNALLNGIENPFGNNEQTLYIIHPTNASSSLVLSDFYINDGQILNISFYVKVSAENNMTGLKISAKDHGSTSASNTTLISAFTTKNYEDEDHNDFALVNLFVTNTLEDGEARDFDLILDLGTTDPVTDYKKLTKGYALVTGIQATLISQEEFDRVAETTYVGTLNLGADKPNGVEEEEDEDTYTLNYSATNKTTVMNKLADDVIGYTGVIGDHKMVGGEMTAYAQEETISGLLNTKYLADYAEFTDEEKDAIYGLEKDGENNYLQALVIKNTSAAAYGYLGTSRTMTAGSTTIVSVKVKVLGNAKAYIYLVNADSLMGFDVLDLTAYKYDGENHEISDELAFSKQFVQTVTAEESKDGWVTVNFIITAGENEIDYRIELWNGSRDGKDASEGIVLFDAASTTTSADYTSYISKLGAEQPEEITYTRIPTKVNYTDDSGNEAVKYETYLPTVVYSQYNEGKTMVASFATLDVTSKRTDKAEDDSTTESASDSATTTPGTDVGLQIASIIIALVLVLVLIIIGVRMILKKTRKEKASAETYYSRDSREKMLEQVKANKAKREAAAMAKMEQPADEPADVEAPAEEQPEEAPAEEESVEEAAPEYDYDNPENNLPKDETDGDKAE